MLEALTRAGLRKPSPTPREQSNQAKYPAPRKLTICIVNGTTDQIIHKYVPTYRLAALSTKAAEVLDAKPWAGKYKVYGKYESSAMNSVIRTLILGQEPTIHTADLSTNLRKYEASLRLGIPCTQPNIKSLLSCINEQISTSAITSDVLAFVTYHLGSKDPVFKHMANVLCYQRFKGGVSDVEAFEKIVGRTRAMQKAMCQIDRAHRERREAINASKRGRRVGGTDALGVEGLVETTVRGKVANDGVQQSKLLKLLKGEEGSDGEDVEVEKVE